jgi:hypothetical protein
MKPCLIAVTIIIALCGHAHAAPPQPSCDTVKQRLTAAPHVLELPITVHLLQTDVIGKNDAWQSIDEPSVNSGHGIYVVCHDDTFVSVSADVDVPTPPRPANADPSEWCKRFPDECRPISISINRVAVVMYGYTGWPAHKVMAATRKLFDERTTYEATMNRSEDQFIAQSELELPDAWAELHWNDFTIMPKED